MHGPSLRTRIADLIRVLGAPVLNLCARLRGRRVAAAVVYHRLEPGAPPWRETEPNLSLGSDQFEVQLRELRRMYRLVPTAELREAARTRRRGQRIPVAVTFDDDYPSHLHTAAPLLGRSEVPATFFVCGASFDRPHGFWWQRLMRATEAGMVELDQLRERVPARSPTRPDRRDLRQLAADIEWMPDIDREALSDWLLDIAGPDRPDDGLTASQVADLTAAGFDVGFHTRRHPNLTVLPASDVEAALQDGREAVEAATGHRISQFAYPGGKASAEVIRATQKAGYEVAFLADGGPIEVDTHPLTMRRLDPTWCRRRGQLAWAMARMMLRSPDPGPLA